MAEQLPYRDMYYVYAIYNRKHGKIYIGQTINLDKRLEMHNNKTFGLSYTSRFDGDWNLIHLESFSTQVEALIREKQLKSYKGRESVRKLIRP